MTEILTGYPDSEWMYYVASHDEDAILQVDELDELVWEHLWMRPVSASSLDEWDYDGPTLTRDKNGRFQSVVCWVECGKDTPGAEPWTGVRYG